MKKKKRILLLSHLLKARRTDSLGTGRVAGLSGCRATRKGGQILAEGLHREKDFSKGSFPPPCAGQGPVTTVSPPPWWTVPGTPPEGPTRMPAPGEGQGEEGRLNDRVG